MGEGIVLLVLWLYATNLWWRYLAPFIGAQLHSLNRQLQARPFLLSLLKRFTDGGFVLALLFLVYKLAGDTDWGASLRGYVHDMIPDVSTELILLYIPLRRFLDRRFADRDPSGELGNGRARQHRIGERIKAARKDRGWTRKQLGGLAGIKVDRLRRIENGAKMADTELTALSRVLGLSILTLTE